MDKLNRNMPQTSYNFIIVAYLKIYFIVEVTLEILMQLANYYEIY